MEYRGWQISPKNTFAQEVSNATQFFIEKYGTPPQVLEYSDQLESVELPEGLQLVTNVVRIPKNVILLGRNEEDANNWP